MIMKKQIIGYMVEISKKVFDEKGDPDGGGLSWIAKTGIAFSVLVVIITALNAAFPGLIQAIITRIQQFFA